MFIIKKIIHSRTISMGGLCAITKTINDPFMSFLATRSLIFINADFTVTILRTEHILKLMSKLNTAVINTDFFILIRFKLALDYLLDHLFNFSSKKKEKKFDSITFPYDSLCYICIFVFIRLGINRGRISNEQAKKKSDRSIMSRCIFFLHFFAFDYDLAFHYRLGRNEKLMIF